MKKYLPYILIVLLGIGTSFFAYTKLNAETGDIETMQIVVPSHDISPYQEVRPSDLKMKTITLTEAVEDVVTDPQVLIGKRFNITLFKDWSINSKTIKNENQLENKHIVAINTDPARSAKATPGDMVDIYLASSLVVEQGEGIKWAERIIENVIVLSVEDNLAILAVDKNDTHKLVNGATKDSEYYVLAIRQQIIENAPYVDEEESEINGEDV